ncbi:MAG: hypothetical protein IJE07_08510 [Clostridia bacterium]|nr:hypothetical protein [Clostridia bacterium]
MCRNVLRRFGSVLLVLAYLLIMLFGFLSGMLSEGLIGVKAPSAGVLADVIVWFGMVVGVSPLIPLAAMAFAPRQARTAWWWIIRLLPFALLAVQLALAAVAGVL